MLPRRREIAVEPLHEAVAPPVPDLKLEYQPYGTVADRFRQREFALGGRELFVEFVFLPLIYAVHAVAAHVATAAYPRSAPVPFMVSDFFNFFDSRVGERSFARPLV